MIKDAQSFNKKFKTSASGKHKCLLTARKITSAWRISKLAWVLIFRIATDVNFREVFYVANCITLFALV